MPFVKCNQLQVQSMALRAGSEEIMWIIGVMKEILHNGGKMSIDEITIWVRHQCSSGHMNVPDVKGIIQQNPNFFSLDDSTPRKSYVTVRINIGLCENHWTKEGCPNADCKYLHICRYFITSSCTELDCVYGHDFKDQHNEFILRKCGLVNQLSDVELKAIFRPRVATPEICKFYNNIGGCKKEGGRGCPALHICLHYVMNECKFGQNCKRSHNIFDQQPKFILSRLGWNLSRSPKDVLADFRMLYERHNVDDDCSLSQAPKSTSAMPFSMQHTQLRKPSVCTFYNTAKGCKNQDSCKHLHICKHFVERNCQHGSSCRRSHNIMDRQPLHILESLGWDTQRDGDALLQDLMSQLSSMLSVRIAPSPGTPGNSDTYQKLPVSSPKSQSSLRAAGKNAVDNNGDLEICTYNLKGGCNYGAKCIRKHAKAPYSWEYSDKFNSKDIWVEFDEDNKKSIELCYCDPDCNECYAQLGNKSGATATVKIDFDSLIYSSLQVGKGKVRRIGTHSWGKVPLNKPFVTKWLWYWKNEMDVWVEYGKQQRSGSKADISSRDFEEQYVQQKDVIQFNTDSHCYEANLKEMYQINKAIGTKRPIRRRPEHVGSCGKGIQRTDSSLKSVDIDYPDHWEFSDLKSDVGFQVIPIHKHGKTANEFVKIEKLFQKTMSGYPIKHILRIQNFDLWEDYQRKKAKLQKANKQGHVAERDLFHGTRSEYIQAICQQGFDWRITGSSHGNVYGKGSYFARDASYSYKYTDSKKLFVVTVLVGEYTRGRADMVRPPPKDPTKPWINLYDSCVDNEKDPSVFVIFEKEQSYPAYIIEY